jgi:formate dehydrogenase
MKFKINLQQGIAKAPKLKMCVTAGIGSDHVDLEAACERKIAVTEVRFYLQKV